MLARIHSLRIIEYVEHRNKVALNLDRIRRKKAGRKTTQSIYEVKFEPRVQHPTSQELYPSSAFLATLLLALNNGHFWFYPVYELRNTLVIFIVNECLWLSV